MGRQAARRLISPVVLGIFAGDARKLSAVAAFPRLVAMEKAHGSLFKAMRAGRRRGVPPPGHKTFLDGIQALPRAVAAMPGIDVRCNRPVTSIGRSTGGGFTVTSSGGEHAADAVVVAADLPAAADLIAGVSAAAADELRQIDSPPMAVVHTAFDAQATAHLEPAYGFLVARGESIRMLGCQYETATFRGRSPEGQFLARSMFGGGVDPEAANLDDDELVALTRPRIAPHRRHRAIAGFHPRRPLAARDPAVRPRPSATGGQNRGRPRRNRRLPPCRQRALRHRPEPSDRRRRRMW